MDYAAYTDEELIEMVQGGDREAEEYIIRKYKDAIRGRTRLYSIVGADAEDILQEGMIGIFKAIKSYEKGKNASFKTFMELCVNRQIITAIRRADRQKHSPLNNSISLDLEYADSGEKYKEVEFLEGNVFERPEMAMLVKSTLDEIASNDKNVFSKLEYEVLKEYLAGKDYNAIAEGLGKSPKAVDNALQRIKRKISGLF